jgi:hypothetical protein
MDAQPPPLSPRRESSLNVHGYLSARMAERKARNRKAFFVKDVEDDAFDIITIDRKDETMKNVARHPWHQMDGQPKNWDEETFHKERRENEKPMNSTTTPGLHAGKSMRIQTNQVNPPIPDRHSKPSYKMDGISRMALSLLYGPKYPVEEEPHETNTQDPLPRRSQRKHRRAASAMTSEAAQQETPSPESQQLDKELPALPAVPRGARRLEWPHEQTAWSPLEQPHKNHTINDSYADSYASRGRRERTMAGGTDVVSLGKATKKVRKGPAPANPFDDYYALR